MYSCSWWPTRYSPSIDDIGGGHRRVDLAALDRVAREDMIALERVEDRGALLGARMDASARLAQGGPIGRRDERERLGMVADLAADRDQDRLVVLDEAHDVRARDVVRGDDDDLRPVEVLVAFQLDQAGVGILAPDRGPVPGAREDEVVGVQGDAGELGRALATQRAGGPGTAGDGRTAGHDEGRRVRRRGCRRHGRAAGVDGTLRQAV